MSADESRRMEPVPIQITTTNGQLCYRHFYNNHDQNTIVILPGDMVFAFHSPHHEHTSNDTLILRSLPSLNTLLRSIGGPQITPKEILASFSYLGVCLGDWTHDESIPWLRGIDMVHAGFTTYLNVFDDVTAPTPRLPKTLPRHAYLWLRACRMNPETRQIEPFNGDIEKAAVIADDSGNQLRASDFAEPEDEAKMLEALEDWGEIEIPTDRDLAANTAAAEEKKKAQEQRTKHERMLEVDPATHPYFWQFVPVCSTHADLQLDALGILPGWFSAVNRAQTNFGRWFATYPYLIYLGHMLRWPNRVPALPLENEIMQYAIYGQTSLSRLRYDHVMYEERFKLQSVEIDSQNC